MGLLTPPTPHRLTTAKVSLCRCQKILKDKIDHQGHIASVYLLYCITVSSQGPDTSGQLAFGPSLKGNSPTLPMKFVLFVWKQFYKVLCCSGESSLKSETITQTMS